MVWPFFFFHYLLYLSYLHTYFYNEKWLHAVFHCAISGACTNKDEEPLGTLLVLLAPHSHGVASGSRWGDFGGPPPWKATAGRAVVTEAVDYGGHGRARGLVKLDS